ncbi:uncharacterized protein G2W53_021998 [Senna tora]|uniref:Uncharacterized protein n=1 Tax=Senna tora TaxID=362788 RepID=A0A834TM93_9FABA|nr:uncharacterized protein G2W53_021998 [Senna tora]
MSVPVVFANRSGFDARIGVVKAWQDCGSCLTIFRKTTRGRMSENFTNYEAKDLLLDLMFHLESSRHGRSVDHVLTYSERQIASGFDAGIGFVKAWEERGSCLNIFRTTNRGRISENFTSYEAKDLFCNECNTSIRVVFGNRSGLDPGIGFVKEREDRGSCPNIFRTTNRGRISENITNYKAKDLLHKSRSDLKSLHELQGKRLVLQVSETHRFALYLRNAVDLMFQLESSRHGRSVDHVLTYCGSEIKSGFDVGIRFVKAWEERGSCLNIFRTTNRGRITETFMNYEAKDLFRK